MFWPRFPYTKVKSAITLNGIVECDHERNLIKNRAQLDGLFFEWF